MARYCTHCGNEVNENAVVCVKCGCSTKPANQVAEVDDGVSVGLVILAELQLLSLGLFASCL